jgi:hypothetical protein
VGDTVDEAVYLFAALDRLCHVQLMVEAAAANNIPKTLISDEDAEYTANSIREPQAKVRISISLWSTVTHQPFQYNPEYQLLLKETGGDFLK